MNSFVLGQWNLGNDSMDVREVSPVVRVLEPIVLCGQNEQVLRLAKQKIDYERRRRNDSG